VVVGNSPAPAPREQPTSEGDLLLESGRGMAFQKRVIGGSDLWKIKKSPPDRSEDGAEDSLSIPPHGKIMP